MVKIEMLKGPPFEQKWLFLNLKTYANKKTARLGLTFTKV